MHFHIFTIPRVYALNDTIKHIIKYLLTIVARCDIAGLFIILLKSFRRSETRQLDQNVTIESGNYIYSATVNTVSTRGFTPIVLFFLQSWKEERSQREMESKQITDSAIAGCFSKQLR